MYKGITVEIRHSDIDSLGRITRHHPWKRANSLVQQFAQLLTVQMSGQIQTVKDTGNTDRSVNVVTSNFFVNAILGALTSGILIGTGTNAVAMSDINLQTQVSANIIHAASAVISENPDASTWRTVISRAFTNNTGSSLAIKEVGLVAAVFVTSATRYFLLDRTLYNLTINNGAGNTLTYRITITF